MAFLWRRKPRTMTGPTFTVLTALVSPTRSPARRRYREHHAHDADGGRYRGESLAEPGEADQQLLADDVVEQHAGRSPRILGPVTSNPTEVTPRKCTSTSRVRSGPGWYAQRANPNITSGRAVYGIEPPHIAWMAKGELGSKTASQAITHAVASQSPPAANALSLPEPPQRPQTRGRRPSPRPPAARVADALGSTSAFLR